MEDIDQVLNALFTKLHSQFDKRQLKRAIKTCDESALKIAET